MGWLDRWREARAEAAVRRQLVALEHERRLATRGGHLGPAVKMPTDVRVNMGPAAGMDVALAVRHGYRSHRGLGDPERDQWIIDNPNAVRLAS